MTAPELILRWCAVYTRGLSPAVAGDRRDELASDLWEHAAAEPRAAAAMLSRAVRGVPADLAWRYEQRRAAQRLVPMQTRVLGGLMVGLVAFAASSLIVFGVVAVARTAHYVSMQYVLPWSSTAVAVLSFTALAVVGTVLLLRRRSRPLGAIVLAASTPLVHFGLYDLYNKSAVIVALNNAADWSVSVVCIMGALALVFSAAAILWMPARKARI